MSSPTQSDPWIGRLLGDHQRYRLEERLGRGGMGDVFLAMDTLLGQQVALKLVKDALVVTEELRERFEREVTLCAALKSDHIVEFRDYGETPEGHPFYVMEYLRGQSLRHLLQQQKQLSVERTTSIITQVCEGLQLAHEGVTLWRDEATASEHIKVIHRDLKPDNIFLVPTALGELVKILDFGIAKIRSDTAEHTQLTRMFIGTFHYAAPEQLRVEADLDERADIYSLGMNLYEMLSGTDPFGLGLNTHNISGMSWAEAHTSKQPLPLRSQPGCGHLPPELEAVVMRCLQKSPDERFASVDELSRALQAVAVSGSGMDVTQTSGQIPEVTITHVPPASEQGNHSTLNRPLLPAEQIPEAIIARTSPQDKDNGTDNTGPRLTSSANENSDAIIAQTTSSRHRIPINLLFPLGIVIAIGFIGMVIVYAYSQLQLHKTQVLNDIKALKADEKYEGCITKAQTFTQDSTLYNDAQGLLSECQLEYAKKLAADEDFEAAIATAREIPENSSVYPQAEVLIEQWSEQVDEGVW